MIMDVLSLNIEHFFVSFALVSMFSEREDTFQELSMQYEHLQAE